MLNTNMKHIQGKEESLSFEMHKSYLHLNFSPFHFVAYSSLDFHNMFVGHNLRKKYHWLCNNSMVTQTT